MWSSSTLKWRIAGRKVTLSLVLLCTTQAWTTLGAEALHIATASNFLPTLQKLVRQFTKDQVLDTNFVISSGSTGKLTTQIIFGAQYDIFLSADQAHVQTLVENQLAIESTRKVYAHGQLVLWSPSKSLSNFDIATIPSVFASQYVSRANPKLAPYGRATMQFAESLQWEPRWVTVENVGQVATTVTTGNAQAAVLPLSLLLSLEPPAPTSQYQLIPQEFHAPIRQEAVSLTNPEKSYKSLIFIDFLSSKSAQRTIQDAGYLLP